MLPFLVDFERLCFFLGPVVFLDLAALEKIDFGGSLVDHGIEKTSLGEIGLDNHF